MHRHEFFQTNQTKSKSCVLITGRSESGYKLLIIIISEIYEDVLCTGTRSFKQNLNRIRIEGEVFLVNCGQCPNYILTMS